MKITLKPFSFRSPLWAAATPMILFYLFIVGRHWIPMHDSLEGLLWYHQLLGNLAFAPGISTWAPNLTWGQNLNLLAVATFSPSLFFIAPLAKLTHQLNAATMFYTAMLIDEAILLWGLYRLGSSIYKNKTAVLFVCFTISGTVCWTIQNWWNFHFFYALPLSFFYLLRGIRRQSFFDLAKGLCIVSFTGLVGNLIYCAPLQLFLALIFLGVTIRANPRLKIRISSLKERKTLLGLLLLLCAALIPVATAIQGGLPEIRSPGRTADGKLTYDTFLDHANDSDLIFAKSLFDGFEYGFDRKLESNRGNNSPYGGVLLLTFFAIGILFSASTERFVFLWLAGAGFLLYLGRASFLAPLLYYVPGLSNFRHFGLLFPFIRLMVVLIAGFGFDEMIELYSNQKNQFFRRLLPTVIVLLFASAGLTVYFYLQHSPAENPFYFKRAAVQAIVLTTALVVFIRLWAGQSVIRGKEWVQVLLTLVLIDCYSYRACLNNLGLLATSQKLWSLFELRPPQYTENRTLRPEKGENYQVLSNEVIGRSGAMFNVVDVFAGADVCYHSFRTDTVSQPISSLYHYLKPSDKVAPGIFRAIGCEQNKKLQVYSRLAVLPVESDVRDYMFSPNFEKPRLLTDADEYLRFSNLTSSGTRTKPDLLADRSAESDSAVAAKIDVQKFMPNSLKVDVTAPSSADPAKFFWLYYADTWHPFWEAYLNGKQIPILKANLGFKAIQIPAGLSHVEFIHRSDYNAFLFIFLWVCCGLLILPVLSEMTTSLFRT